MKFQDYYEILGVERTADTAAIKKAYRKLALEWHPDRHSADGKGEAEKKFKQITEAYEVLSDEEKRRKYDRFGKDWEHGQDFQPPPGGRGMSPEEFAEAFGEGGGFSDFFKSVFGDQFRQGYGSGGAHPRYRHRGADVQAELELTVGQAIGGGKSRFEVPATSACSRCGGLGFLGQHVCPSCGGVGHQSSRRTVDLTIPRRVRDGQSLRLRGLGEPGMEGGETGDLILTLRLRSDETYRCSGPDIEADVPLAPWELLKGARIDVRTPDGVLVVTIPPETRAGARLRLRGKGLDDGRGGRGDFLVVVRCALPEPLTGRQRELILELEQGDGGNVTGGARVGGST